MKRARLAACRDQARANRHAAAQEAAPAARGDLVADVPIVPVQEGPPSVLELDQIIAEHSPAIGACAPETRGEFLVDARIQGATGGISGVALSGPGAYGVSVQCVMAALSAVRTRTFNGAVDVRWSVDMGRAPATSGGER